MSRRRLVPAGLAALLLASGLAGCGDGAPEPRRLAPADLPAGWAPVQGEDFAFARPPGFAPLPRRDRPEGELLLGFERPGASTGGLPSQVGIGVQDETSEPLAQAVRLAQEESRIAYPGYRVLRRSTPAVAGGRAVRIDAEYEAFTEARERVRTVGLWVQTASGRRVNLFARGPAEDFSAQGLDAIARTLRLP